MLKKLLVFGLVVGCGQVAEGQSDKAFITFEGVTTEPVTYWMERTNATNSPPDGGIDFVLPSQAAGATALVLRDEWIGVPDMTSGNSRIQFRGKPAWYTKTATTEDTLWWLSNDSGASWHDLEPSVPVTLSGITFTFDSYLTSNPVMQPQGNVPAVGVWGLCVMVLMIVVGATMVLRQRRSAEGSL